MSQDKPTLAAEKPRRPGDQAPAARADKKAGTAQQTVAGSGAPFRPTNPPLHPTPPDPIPFSPASTQAERHTEIMSAQQAIIPLAWLAVVEGVGGRRGFVKTLAAETVVGRAGGDLILNDPAVSGQHLKIKLETPGEGKHAFVLYDMASSNGTFVGDRETYQEDESRVYRHVLQDGDFVLVGKTTLVFKQV